LKFSKALLPSAHLPSVLRPRSLISSKPESTPHGHELSVMRFEWDPEKARRNQAKHGVSWNLDRCDLGNGR
jgi:hypothetical protein